MKFEEFRAQIGEQFDETDELTGALLGAAVEVHREFGPGLAEVHYEMALCHELELRGIRFERQVPVPVVYKGKHIGEARVDLVVGDRIIVELKACEALNSVHRAQLITYCV